MVITAVLTSVTAVLYGCGGVGERSRHRRCGASQMPQGKEHAHDPQE